MAVSVTASRFALLKIEGSDDEGASGKKQQKSKDTRSKSAQKKKSKKKQNTDAADLRSLAFGGGGPKSAGVPRSSGTQNVTPPQAEQYQSWAEHDKDQVDVMFQSELQQAILLSKVESEKQVSLNTEHAKNSDKHSQREEQTSAEEGARKKNKGKPKGKHKSMSLEEFNQGQAPTDRKQEPDVDHRKISGSGDNFFTDVAADAANMLKKDRLQEEYKKQYKVQAVLQAKHNTELETKDNTIEQLKAELAESQEELKQVKKRNKQLCFILGQGEMKEKAEILQQVDSLSQVKDELTTQVTTLTCELEKERSKVHALQNEISKLKHKGK